MKRIAVLLVLSLVAVACRTQAPVPPPPLPVEVSPLLPEPIDPPTGDREVVCNLRYDPSSIILDAFFALDDTTLDENGRFAMEDSARFLHAQPDMHVLIEGHCDERGTEQYNLALGERRAEAAASYLAILGVDRRRIRTTSLGEERPFEQGSDEKAWARNRRAHLVPELVR